MKTIFIYGCKCDAAVDEATIRNIFAFCSLCIGSLVLIAWPRKPRDAPRYMPVNVLAPGLIGCSTHGD